MSRKPRPRRNPTDRPSHRHVAAAIARTFTPAECDLVWLALDRMVCPPLASREYLQLEAIALSRGDVSALARLCESSVNDPWAVGSAFLQTEPFGAWQPDWWRSDDT